MAVYATEHKIGATYIWLAGVQDSAPTQSVFLGESVIVDLNSSGEPVGIEILQSLEVTRGLEEQQHSDVAGVPS